MGDDGFPETICRSYHHQCACYSIVRSFSETVHKRHDGGGIKNVKSKLEASEVKSATITLENSNLRIVLDKNTGAVVHIGCVRTGWSVLDWEELGLSFQLLVSTRTAEDWHTKGRRNVIAEGTRQPAPLVQEDKNGKRRHIQVEPDCPFERRGSGHRSGVPRACECGGYDFFNEDREQVQPFRRERLVPVFRRDRGTTVT